MPYVVAVQHALRGNTRRRASSRLTTKSYLRETVVTARSLSLDCCRGTIHPISLGMNLAGRLKKIDAKCVRAHRLLNKIAIAEVSDPSIFGLADDVRKAIEDLTNAREMLNDLAEEPPNN